MNNIELIRVDDIKHEPPEDFVLILPPIESEGNSDEDEFEAKQKFLTQQGYQSHLSEINSSQAIKPLQCDQCHVSCAKKKNMKLHLKNHHLGQQFKCSDCSFSGSSLRYLTQHRESHRHKCDECGKTFRFQIGLTNHVKEHDADNQLRCPICLKVFKNNQGLVCHQLRIHGVLRSAARTFICDICSKATLNKTNLRVHMQTHLKPFKCQHCAKGFAVEKLLTLHLLRPKLKREDFLRCSPSHICIYCPKYFANLKQLKKHLRLHERVDCCPLCDSFESLKKITKHMQNQDDEKFKCRHCSETLCTSKLLKLHLLEQHINATE